jgi:hypothetical protein
MEVSEIWKPVLYFEGFYEVSNFGRIRRITRDIIEKNTGKHKVIKGRMLKPWINTKGYPSVTLSINSKVKYMRVHRIVARAFIPNPLNLPEVNHINEIKTDNNVSNLEWCTHLQNIRHGTGIERSVAKRRLNPNKKNRGEGCGTSKLKNEQVIEIYKSNKLYIELTKNYGVSFSCISNIKNRKSWSHLTNKL